VVAITLTNWGLTVGPIPTAKYPTFIISSSVVTTG
jgi:hypothetical protein